MEQYKQEFIEFMVESQVLKFGEFTLKSGRKSPFFMNARRSAAARIRRIRAEFPDPEQRRAVLNAQGGVSFAACIGAFILLMLVGSLCSMLLGPDLNALVGTFI